MDNRGGCIASFTLCQSIAVDLTGYSGHCDVLADIVEHAALVNCVLKNKSLMVLPVDLAANPHLFFVTPKVLK